MRTLFVIVAVLMGAIGQAYADCKAEVDQAFAKLRENRNRHPVRERRERTSTHVNLRLENNPGSGAIHARGSS